MYAPPAVILRRNGWGNVRSAENGIHWRKKRKDLLLPQEGRPAEEHIMHRKAQAEQTGLNQLKQM